MKGEKALVSDEPRREARRGEKNERLAWKERRKEAGEKKRGVGMLTRVEEVEGKKGATENERVWREEKRELRGREKMRV